MQNDQPGDTPQDESFARHPIHATEEEAAHLRQVADEGESPRTPAIVVGAVPAFILPLAASLMLLGFALYYFA
jgi:hypothetical protein